MYLKALEIQGFKSFPEKTLLTFEKDITAIVGPNGSGKSNISDAIRWVMGEQSSRSLRGGKMEDVIFGGTEKRKQVGFAEVSLVIDNSDRIFDTDHMEVMITRRYYRSGESEYYINRESVRLKDIHELLMDTGLGREGYAIIDQGRTAEILSLKSVDRRDIFEEAAGISRFRHRKEESERKLEKTEENLTRIRDKIAELELQVEPLREQSEVAKKYLVLRDELREVEVSLWLETLEGLRTKSIKLTAEYDEAKEKLAGVQDALENMYRSAETFSERMREKDLRAEEARADISRLEAQANELESVAAVLKANLESNTATIERMMVELSEQESRTDTLTVQIGDRESRLNTIDAEKRELEDTRDSLLEEMSDIAREMGDRSSEMDLVLRQESGESRILAEKKERLSALASTVQELYDRESSLSSDLAAAKERAESSEKEIAGCRQELKKTSEEAESLSNMISGHTIRLESRRSKVEGLKGKVMNLTMEHGAIRSRIGLLSDMEREYQGFSKAVKEVMHEARKGVLRNIHGPVANLVQVTDDYALAIETALGAASQNIIVDTPEDGKYAIRYLKRTGAGRATFLPIASIKPYELREQGIGDEPGVIGIAVDLVDYDRQYDDIYRNLLGRTVIVEDMDDAIHLSKKYAGRFRTVTLDGQVINAGGSMSGGSASKNTGVISRANEIKRLRANEKRLSTELLQNKEALTEAERQLSGANTELDSNRNELRQLEDAVLRLKASHSALEIRLADAKGATESCQMELQSVRDRIASGTVQIGTLKEEIAISEERLSGYRSQAEELTQGSEGLNTRRAALSDRLGELQAKMASLDTERESAQKSIDELASLSSSLTGDREQKRASIKAIQIQNEEILEKISEKKAELMKNAEELEASRARLTQINGEKLEMEAERNRSDRETQEKNREILDMERAAARLEQKKLAADMEEKQIIDKLWDTYELTLTAAAPVRQPIESISAATRSVAKLKRDISALGPPNIGAIEEFERVNSRYIFLSEQRDDVEKAKNELMGIIGDITGEMTEIFGREFKNIAASFRETFTELFGGGKAALELEDESDILNCGIEIRVQPPGKSLKTITLLSGGEKAFTAIALYFAIQKIRPTPFCVMDEIEAALDEANVLRYAEYMRRLSGKTQFIVITHRRGTMEEADLLYGVAMQEQGVSKVIHVDLEEAEKTISA